MEPDLIAKQPLYIVQIIDGQIGQVDHQIQISAGLLLLENLADFRLCHNSDVQLSQCRVRADDLLNCRELKRVIR